jgi:G3E family GTPase
MQITRHAETRKQIALADRIVLTKTDMVEGDARVREAVRGLNKVAPILTARQGEVDAAALFPPAFLDPTATASGRSGLFAETVDGDPGHAARLDVVALYADRPLLWRAFDDWLRGVRLLHSEQLLRVKGMLAVDGMQGPVVVHGVHHVLHAPVALESWPGKDRRSRLVLIADEATTSAIQASWANALPGMLTH